MISYRFMLTDSLSKVFPDHPPAPLQTKVLSCLWGERVSFQIAYWVDFSGAFELEDTLAFQVDAGEHVQVTLRKVDLSPSRLPCTAEHDEDYITTVPGLFPDLLSPITEPIKALHHQWNAVWVDLEPDPQAVGSPINIEIRDSRRKIYQSFLQLRVVPTLLPPQKLIHTELLHTDCLADYYRVEVFSEQHWTLIESFIRTAVQHGINMIYTPLFTPPMDTAVGGERTTVQLIGVQRTVEGEYNFDFSELLRWARLCKDCGVEYLELSHLFTQWGAYHAPKIMAGTPDGFRRIFGWETDSHGKEYTAFLDYFLPCLHEFLDQNHLLNCTWMHISDEPTQEQLDSYQQAKDIVRRHIPDLPIIDALSSFSFYESGAVEIPIACSNHIDPFLEAGVEKLWTYYCVAQGVDVSNRFFAMPSYRNRILGVQLYLYNIQGFLHWGYNFYNSRCSVHPINPFCITDAGGEFPSGDPFLVYPGEDGKPLASIRLMVLQEALQDLRALQLLESLTGREHVCQLIMQKAGMLITFKQYPRSSEFLQGLRQAVNDEICRNLASNDCC